MVKTWEPSAMMMGVEVDVEATNTHQGISMD